MHLSCEVCRATLPSEDVLINFAVVKCHSCNAIYDLSGRKARGITASAQDNPKLVRAKVPLPTRFKVNEASGATRITWRWFTRNHITMLFFWIFWNGFFLFAGSGIVPIKDEDLLFFKIGIPIFVAIGMGGAYHTLTGLLNHTTIEVNRIWLTIRHGPLPWPGNVRVPSRQLTQLYGEEVVHTDSETQNVTYTYNLNALDREGRKIKLLTNLPEEEQVLYLEQTLERRLGIEDTPVSGEVATRTTAA